MAQLSINACAGPGEAQPLGPQVPTLAEARAHCRRLARSHYENFTVASWFLPRRLLPHFFAVYAFCRIADDLADAGGDAAASLRGLDGWEAKLHRAFAGTADHPVFVALGASIREFGLPAAPFERLLAAFRQDQRVDRYATHDEVLGYCRNSANPVGELVLRMGRCFDPSLQELSDSICTGLQLANFCQDVRRDWQGGRIYLPASTLAAAGCTERDFTQRRATTGFRRALAEEVDRAESYLRRGRGLVERVPGFLRVDVSLFVAGGLAVLEEIRRLNYDVWGRRPVVSRARKLSLLWQSWRQARRGGAEGGSP